MSPSTKVVIEAFRIEITNPICDTHKASLLKEEALTLWGRIEIEKGISPISFLSRRQRS
jgi:hypothetical protein